MIIRNYDEKKAERIPRRIHGDWIVNTKNGSFKLFEEGGPDDNPENCQNLHCYDAIQFGEMPGPHPFSPWGVFRQFNREGPTQFRERMVSLNVDEPGDDLVDGLFLHTQIEGRVLSYEVNTESNRISIWLNHNTEKNIFIETNNFGPTERLDPLPVPVNLSVDRAVLEEPGPVDIELFPPLVMDHLGRTFLARKVSGWEICGERALVLNIKGSLYWRDVQTGRVERLPQEMNGMTPVHCSPDGQDIFLKNIVGHGMFLYRPKEGRLMQIAQNGLNLTWSSDGKKVAMVWTWSSNSLDNQFMFEQPWIYFPEGLSYRLVLLSSNRLPYRPLWRITETDRNRFQWVLGERYLLGQNISHYDYLRPNKENYKLLVPPVGLWDTGDQGNNMNLCKDFPVIDFVDWKRSIHKLYEIFSVYDGVVIYGNDMMNREIYYHCKESDPCTVLWNGVYHKKLIPNRNELWSLNNYLLGKIDWETGEIVCSVEADSKARFLDGRLLRTKGDEVWLEKVNCR
ncbi:MAG: hypothetical protein HQL07_18540 [Nitrospirae bacterium]|nr:hypothetical protein [Magnetococcales bacterium]